MTPAEEGHFVHRQTEVAEGLPYLFRLAEGREYPDPASRWQPEGVHRPSAVFFPGDFRWSDDAWRGIPREDLVLYELHVGAFTPAGTFDAIVPRLPDLLSLGVTAIELMPVAQFAGERNWGYDGVYPYSVQNSYGGPRALQRLVDAAHRAGLAVILDVVYNHFGSEGNYRGNFGPYFTDRYQTPWAAALNFDGPDSGAVRQFAIDNAQMWVRDFHLDGLRLDAVQAIYDLGPGTSSPSSRRRCSRKPPAPGARSTSSRRATRTTCAGCCRRSAGAMAWTPCGPMISITACTRC